MDVAALLSSTTLPRGPGVAVLTNAGGLGILCADACDAAGLELPRLSPETVSGLADVLPPEASTANPIDMLGSASAELYERALSVLLADPAVDSVIVIFVPAARILPEDVAAAISLGAEGADKPVLPVLMAAEPQPGSFAYPESAARALGRLVERAAWLRRPAGTELVPTGSDRRRAARVVATALRDSDDVWLTSEEARNAPRRAHLVGERSAQDPDQAVAAAEELSFPVVVKTAAAGAHKSEQGGVALDLQRPGRCAKRPSGSAVR